MVDVLWEGHAVTISAGGCGRAGTEIMEPEHRTGCILIGNLEQQSNSGEDAC
jgi:hypothetical protein